MLFFLLLLRQQKSLQKAGGFATVLLYSGWYYTNENG
jgi:hypothetical protein